MPHHDLVIIGSGSGNAVPGGDLEDLDVAIVEDGDFGGTCLNVGCIPSKMLVVPADRVVEAAGAARLGIRFEPPDVDWPAIRDRIFGRIDPVARDGAVYRGEQEDITVYRTRARFTGARRLVLDSGEELTADRVVVAVGSRPRGLDVDGLTGADPDRGVHTSDTVMRMAELPPRMVVVGGGSVACEMAHVFAALGVEVTQVQRSGGLLVHEEAEISSRYTRVAGSRYDVRLSTTVAAADRRDGAWHLRLDGPGSPGPVEAESVLLAVGRRPNTDLLDAVSGGLETHPDGRVVTDAEQRTTAEGVWALGDVASMHQLKHVANGEARIVAHNLAVDLGRRPGPPARHDDRPVPHGVFGHPQVASFGPTAAELDEAGTPYVSAVRELADVAYGWALEDDTGVLVVHASPEGQVIAGHCLGPQASSVIQPLVQAASFGQHAHEVARGQYWIHPALAELVENALLELPL
jgi:mycothione reductase